MNTTKWTSVFVFCLALVTGNAFAANILTNPGFEDGTLTPWFNSSDFCSGCTWSVTSADAHGGTFSASVVGNRLLQQFAASPTSAITEASLWLKAPGGSAIAAVYFLYSDSTTEENIVSFGDVWTSFNMTSFLDVGKSLAGFGVYGCSGCGVPTFADDFTINTAVPEPETYAMLLAGLGLLGFAARRRQRKLAVA